MAENNAALKALRAKFKKELYGDENIAFLNDILALTIAEVGNSSAEAQRALLETLMNRADAYGKSLKDEYGGGYYEPVNKGKISKQLEEINSNESLRKKIKQRLEEVFEGSNESNFALHNGSLRVAEKAAELGDVRKVINYGTGNETFYNKTNPAGDDHYGGGYSGTRNREQKWLDQFGNLPKGDSEIKNYTKNESKETSNTSSEEQYPVLSEKSEAVKEVVAGEFVNLAANVFPDRTIAAITNSLPANIASLPSASKISREILESIQSGEGVKSFTSAVEQIASAETPVSRLTAIGDIATEYEADIKALYPDLASIDFKSAVEGIVNIAGEESPSQRLVSGLKMMETMDPDKLMTVGDVLKGDDLENIKNALKKVDNLEKQPLSIIFDKSKLNFKAKAFLSSVGKTEGILDSAIENNKIDHIYAKALYGKPEEQAKALEYLTKGQLPDIPGLEESFPTLLSGSLEDIVKSPLATNLLGEEYSGLASTVLTGEKSDVEKALTDIGASKLAEFTPLEEDTSKTLIAGGSEEENKKLRREVGGIALDSFIESNPTLKSIIQWFTNNKELVALLGTAGAFAGLTSLLGGGQLKGFATGLAGITGVRMMLGEEGFNEFSGMMQKAASPVFDMASGLLEGTGLSEVPLVGSFLKGALDLGRENPLAGIAAAGGNFGATAGILAGTNFDELGGKASQIIETLSSEVRKDTQVQQDIAAVGSTHLQDQMVRPTDRSGDTAKNPGNPGISSQAGMFHMLAYPNYQDFGRTGMGSAAGS